MITSRTVTDLRLRGMACASCAATVERRLNELDGVDASVNFAVERAHVEHDTDVSPTDLVSAVEACGYRAEVLSEPGAHNGHDHLSHDLGPGLRTRLIASALLAVPVVLMSMSAAVRFSGWEWVAWALATPIVLWGGYPFHRAALRGARHGARRWTRWSRWARWPPTCGRWSCCAPGPSTMLYFEVAAAVTVFLLAGRYAEARAKRSAGAALRALLTLGAKDAGVLRGGVETRLAVSDLVVGDVFVVRPGERVATDGTVIDGASALDTSAMTGEPVPVDVRPGADVMGGSLNTYGRILVRADKVGADSQLARMARLVTEAQNGKASIQRLADRVSAVFVPAVLVIAALTLIGWLVFGPSVFAAFTAAVAVLIIACPCALGLATPTAILVGTGRGAQLGILFKDPQVLESVIGVDIVVLDKTGTVTTGIMAVVAVEPRDVADADAVLARAAAVEAASEHPIAAAIVTAARDRGLAVAAVVEFANEPGIGVSGIVGGSRVTVARQGPNADPPAPAQPGPAVEVAWDGVVRGVIRLSDVVKPTSSAAVAELKAMGITPVLLTGDGAAVAHRVAEEVGIAGADVFAGVLPTGKAAVVQRLAADGHRVAMVGDGVNDSVALATADIGMAMGTGTDVAIEAADVTLVRGDLRTVPTALRLAARTLRTIRVNLFWAFGYNVAAIPLAALGLLNPMIAGAAMAASSVLVVANSLRLRSFS